MLNKFLLALISIILLSGCARQHLHHAAKDKSFAKNNNTQLSCKLMPEELRIRKETVLAELKTKVLERKELPNGYAFKFTGDDQMVDQLVEFIKTERECCAFFVFDLSISGDKSEAWLTLTGVEGSKDFVTQELGL